MNSQTVVQDVENTDNATRIMSLLETLRQKVQNFAVLDIQGQRVGEVNNLVLDANRQLNLVISEDPNALNNNRFFLLPSKLIKKIDTSKRSLYMEIDKLAISHQEYLGKEVPENENILENSNPVTEVNSTAVPKYNLENVVGEDIIRLLGERLIVDSTKRKIGEVIVRKEIETRMVQVPVRREKLIVEQISPEHKQLAEIDLGLTEISGIDFAENQRPEFASLKGSLTVSGDFSSPKIASLLLNAIALERNHKCKQVRVTIVVEDESTQKKYQEWFDRCSQGQEPKAEK
ncbi:YsnF/AvaK domain-containing protein [Plectonema radiosum NIES-515]|uniref:YsnF/AvaK domain-containing protein n=1 Tax=Plectonema radiosum NIES-515 TaxID=2986073 RepID=A0ABT3ASS8_9CYAN|nr:YsnF/AvaK domain-containing protein [Plectonema radiosum]MCV3212174.1 YsnF/AvaK domain-containing protein [Plectonema radiosum NIES-515]